MGYRMSELERAAEVAQRHPGWVVWSDCPAATQAGSLRTVEAGSYTELDELLREATV